MTEAGLPLGAVVGACGTGDEVPALGVVPAAGCSVAADPAAAGGAPPVSGGALAACAASGSIAIAARTAAKLLIWKNGLVLMTLPELRYSLMSIVHCSPVSSET